MSQLSRFAEYVQEMKDCQSFSSQYPEQVWCDYNDDWSTYVISGGIRPNRPHLI